MGAFKKLRVVFFEILVLYFAKETKYFVQKIVACLYAINKVFLMKYFPVCKLENANSDAYS